MLLTTTPYNLEGCMQLKNKLYFFQNSKLPLSIVFWERRSQIIMYLPIIENLLGGPNRDSNEYKKLEKNPYHCNSPQPFNFDHQRLMLVYGSAASHV